MAANDYYSNHPQQAQPGASQSHLSPFSDANAYNSNNNSAISVNQHGDTSYHSGYDSSSNLTGNSSSKKPNDPFADNIAMSEHPQHGYYGGQGQGQYPQQPPVGAVRPDTLPVHKKQKPYQNVPFYKNSHWPWVCYILGAVQVGVFVGEIIRNQTLTGSPIETKPNFNILIGPSPFVLINMGARYVPCMTQVKALQNQENLYFFCPNATSLDQASNGCSLATLCGMGAVQGEQPYQWWRFITPMFLHAGVLHILFNMLVQFFLGAQMEREIGSIRFFIVYFASGFMGFLMGGLWAPQGLASTGASGALAGIIALVLIDLFYTWRERLHPVRDLLYLLFDLAIAFVIGLLPGVDNFAHIGGFLTGLCLGIVVLRSPPALRQRIGEADPAYSTVTNPNGMVRFAKSPVGFFKGRKPFWWAWWIVRAALLTFSVIIFIVLLKYFYNINRAECKWCKHLTCLPISNWCSIGQLTPNSN